MPVEKQFRWWVTARKALIAAIYAGAAVLVAEFSDLPPEQYVWAPVAIAAVEALRNLVKFRLER
jgi:hypothetical protein